MAPIVAGRAKGSFSPPSQVIAGGGVVSVGVRAGTRMHSGVPDQASSGDEDDNERAPKPMMMIPDQYANG
ncbi:putative septum site-determining protein MinC [Anopheles sinensis]|uniref:Putative septum site-determining protein MinC n=1 Tax=Anopheles sinensis TaxID=74873 RepID=A0A084VEE2_ANOSI|nr:putative septum site-determining protein MinC [Anopheles sinensis]